MKTKNAIVMATSSVCLCGIWMNVMSKLKEQLSIHPRYFFYYDEAQFIKDKNEFLSKVGEDVFFHSELDGWKGKGFYQAQRNNVLDANILELIAPYELIALKMMDRLDPLSDTFTFTYRQYFFRDMLLKWLDIIDELNIEIFISPDVPHRACDYALYVACIVKQIDFICFEMVPFGDSSIIIDSIETFPKTYIESLAELPILDIPDVKKRLDKFRGRKEEYSLWYMDKQARNQNYSLSYKISKLVKTLIRKGWLFRPDIIIKKLFVKTSFSYFVKKNTMPYESVFNLLDGSVLRWKTSKKQSNYLASYNKLIVDVDLENTKYVLVALHYQPELTTSPTGGVFVDQLLIIEMLDRVLPSDIQIFVKEHKSQFYSGFDSPSAGRSDEFYQRLSSFSDRVKPISMELNSFDLIDSCCAIVTVSGTIGVETLVRGKPVLCFGRSWYENCPGAFRIKTKDDLLSAWGEISSSGYKVNESNVESYVKKLSNYFIWGLHSGVYKDISQRSTEETVANVVSGIIRYVKMRDY